ncbi:TrbG/VirB9 family P-type conjugative transfer protein [uncultured Ruegeria sp.]|uniref:TrbG/VirB9 family P-type conjugative transfer protein n=1 Tax=uncultured Ruegeria sp. TaxID=259304 RepID=UPI00261EA354|nr:TrbG/VirB9 family P-type conjugative transfer protein [uncultured Ruegeria sp.]
MTKAIALLLTLTFSLASQAFAEIQPRPDGKNADPRVTHFHYAEHQVYRINVGERLITYVHFPEGETVRSIGAGDTESYQITRLQEGRVIAFKPEVMNSDSNMTVLTNRGTYNFYLVPTEERSNVPFRVTFYTDPKHGRATATRGRNSVVGAAPKPTGQFINQNYARSGTADFAPTAVWDDGVHTYMQIPQDAELPGVFRVLPDGREMMVNTTMKPRGILQVHGTADLWTLRIEDTAICIRNDADAPQSSKTNAAHDTITPQGSKI